jgi:hypothetical protein
MAANWHKILFSGSKIEVAQVTASSIPTTSSTAPELPVLTIDDNTGEVRFISQSVLGVQNGDTTFGISGSDLTGVIFQSSESILNITTNNPSYLAVSITSGSSGIITASFDPADNFITGSPQLNALNYETSSAEDGHDNGPSDYRISFYDTFIHTGSGFTPNSFGSIDDYPDFVPLNPDNTKGIFYGSSVNRGTYTYNLSKLGAVDGPLPNGGTWIPTNPTVAHASNRILHKVINDTPYTSSRYNLWINPTATTHTNSPSASVATLDFNAPTSFVVSNINTPFDGRKNYAWLSASLVGGFTVGNRASLSASLSTFTGSLITNSSSIGTLQGSSSNITSTTSSMALNSFTSSFLTSVVSKEITSIFHGGDIAQITILDDSDSSVESQGRKFQIGAAAPSESPLTDFSENSRHLTISGTFTADQLVIGGGITLEQLNVSSFSGSINYGTSSLHTHTFVGDTLITGGLDVVGPFTLAAALPLEGSNSVPTADNPPQVLVLDTNNVIKVTEINGSNTTLNSEIVNTATAVSESLSASIAVVKTNIAQATPDGDNITLLQSGYNVLTGSFEEGIFFGTGSTEGSTVDFIAGTSSFTSSNSIGSNAGHSLNLNVLTTSHSVSNDGDVTIHYKFNTGSFILATSIYTTSQNITDAVDGLNRYGKLSSNIITGSDPTDTTNITNIADLATNLNEGTGKHFLTGSTIQSFNDLINTPILFNETSSTTQGVATFQLNPDTNDPTGPRNVDFKELKSTNSPKFAGLTIGDDTDPNNPTGILQVDGTLTRIDTTNLNVKDQFVLINSGALEEDGGVVDSDRDPDGGIIVGNGSNSGSMFMYDKSHNRWGFVGADHVNVQALDAESDANNNIVPDVGVRVYVTDPNKFNADGTPKDISEFLYGNSTNNTQLGIMAVNSSVSQNPDGDVYIYA